METKKATQEAASKGLLNDSANIAQSTERHKENATKVTEIFAGAQPKVNPNRVPFGAVLSGNYPHKHGALDFPPPADDLKEFPVWGLPQELQDIVKDVSTAYNCTPTIPAVAMITAAAAAMGKNAHATIGNYGNYASLWPVIIGLTSASKSDPASFFIEPLEKADEQAENTYNAELAEWINNGRKGQEPKLHQKIIGVTTDEAMLQILADNNGAGFLYLDEFATMAGSWGRYAKNGNTQIIGILESIFSQKNTKVSTKTHGTTTIRKPVLNLFATTQPTTWARVMRPILADNGGLFERVLPVFVSRQKGKRNRHTISEQSRMVWREYVDRLLHLPATELSEHPSAAEWRIKAEDYWRQRAEIVEEEERNQLGEVQGSIYLKASYTLYRVALIVAVLNGDTVISAPTMRYAAECCQFFVNNQQKAAMMLLKPEQQGLNKTETLRQLLAHYPQANLSQLANALGLGKNGQPWLSGIKNGRK